MRKDLKILQDNSGIAPTSPLPADFFHRPTLQVARDLIGKMFIRRLRNTVCAGRIVEVEAYREDDPASHAYRGWTPRNASMFLPAGHLYVYFTYGMHYCVNVVTGPGGIGEAVLVRAVEPILGIEAMSRRRYGRSRVSSTAEVRNLTNGPAKLCEAFAIDRSLDGALLGNACSIREAETGGARRIIRSGRIGIRHAADRQWRFFEEGNMWVSRTPR